VTFLAEFSLTAGQEEFATRSVRIVTVITTFNSWKVCHRVIRAFWVVVTLEANLALVRDKQVLVIRGVSQVATRTFPCHRVGETTADGLRGVGMTGRTEVFFVGHQ